MNKFQQGKQLLKMRQEAKKMQEELKKITHSETKGDLKVKVNGAQEFEYVEVDGVEREDLKDLLNKANKNVQKESAKKMMEMGGGLSGLFGN